MADIPPQLGRFKLLQQLGEGAQATVWLAHDPLLDREVAVKLLKPQAIDASEPGTVDEWLHEARAVSRLTHPNIVPVFEADTQGGRSYLVFEYVGGGTLSQRLRAGPKLSAAETVTLLLGVLDGLTAAHAAGLVHRDLKPSNILLDATGRARVMDFGIAARVSPAANAPARIVGTPGYISPEAARGAPAHPQMDVFAAAVMLAEMLSGQRLNHDPDPWRAIQRVQSTDLVLPSGLDGGVDDALRAIVQRGLAREPSARWPSAQAMRDALAGWLRPVSEPDAEAQDAPVLDFLLRRMRHKSDFPALSDSIGRIQRLTQSENESLASLSNEILTDVALTQKLLRLVNTAAYRHTGGGGISTVSRAVALIGFAGIRNLALSLVLLERMENKGHAQRLREDFLRSLMAASLARELCSNQREAEEAFLGAMLHYLGRTLTEFYFPEEADAVRRLVSPAGDGAAPISEATASAQVLGMSYEALGLGVARQWGLPDTLQRAMRRPIGEPPTKLIDDGGERQRWLARAANDMADVILHTPPEQAHAKLKALAQRHARSLGINADTFEQAADTARQHLAQMTQALELHLPQNSRAQRLLAPLTPSVHDSLTAHELARTQVLERPAAAGAQPEAVQASQLLAAGIQEITDAMVNGAQLNGVLRMILETIYRALGLRRVVFCLRDARGQVLTGRLGVGTDVERLQTQVRVDLTCQPPDLMAAVCLKGMDTLIQDARAANIAARLPGWFKGELQAQSFLLLPLMLKGAPLGLIYADHADAGAVQLGEKELSLLRTLRNQAVMAFRQASG
ncbi:protein kinase domain-containing protein [Roseateles asaccharophilus]|uniref:Serine/threonine protein kinase n=1 Tax=Roseateles asaccharophilus TaxID=582607 RepID=A0ABU2A4J7_9BURK|nr:HDOD domain-containing protein [Roseateles asaccharophilus]MDR7331543.1 serine/threonine protein kinase [Roseateles asaccharophilus]